MARHLLTVDETDQQRWATCGPCSLAAVLGRSLSAIRDAFPNQTERRTWTTVPQMRAALDKLGVPWRGTAIDRAPKPHAGDGYVPAVEMPRCGVALVQFRGPWEKLGHGHPSSLEMSHWIGVAPKGHPVGDRWLNYPAVFEVNLLDVPGLEEQHGWTTRAQWEEHGARVVAEGLSRRATGAWWVRAALEIVAA